MTLIPRTAVVLAAAIALCALAASAVAAPIGIYRNVMGTEAQRGQILKLGGDRCKRGGSEEALRVMVGKATSECSYRTPVIGRDLEISAVGRLLSATPNSLRSKAFVAVNLRAGQAGAHYQLAVYPLQRKAQLRRTLPDGQTRYLKIEKDLATVKGLNQANQLRLRAFNITSGPEKGRCRILAFVGPQLIADVTDDAAGELEGRASGFSVGAKGNAKGIVGSFDDVVVRVPNPFE